jgi:hypothetical protein
MKMTQKWGESNYNIRENNVFEYLFFSVHIASFCTVLLGICLRRAFQLISQKELSSTIKKYMQNIRSEAFMAVN